MSKDTRQSSYAAYIQGISPPSEIKIPFANKNLPWENGHNLSTKDKVCRQPGGVDRGGDHRQIFKLQEPPQENREMLPLTKTNLSKWWKNSACGGHIAAKVGPLPCENIIFSTWEMNKLMLCFINTSLFTLGLDVGAVQFWMMSNNMPTLLFWYQSCHRAWGLGCQPGGLVWWASPEDVIGGVLCQLFTLWPVQAPPSFSPSRSPLIVTRWYQITPPDVTSLAPNAKNCWMRW